MLVATRPAGLASTPHPSSQIHARGRCSSCLMKVSLAVRCSTVNESMLPRSSSALRRSCCILLLLSLEFELQARCDGCIAVSRKVVEMGGQDVVSLFHALGNET